MTEYIKKNSITVVCQKDLQILNLSQNLTFLCMENPINTITMSTAHNSEGNFSPMKLVGNQMVFL